MAKKSKTLAFGFVILELILGIAIQLTNGRANAWLSFSAIVLAALIHILSYSDTNAYYFTSIAFICTVCADYLLVVCDPAEPLSAMVFFSVTQICLFLHIYRGIDERKTNLTHIAVRISLLLCVFMVTCAVLGENTDALSVISMLYYANLFINIIFSFFMKSPSCFFSAGLICFLLCDTFVGMGMIGEYISVSESGFLGFLIDPPINMAWLFYVPSQSLIALSPFEKFFISKKIPIRM